MRMSEWRREGHQLLRDLALRPWCKVPTVFLFGSSADAGTTTRSIIEVRLVKSENRRTLVQTTPLRLGDKRGVL